MWVELRYRVTDAQGEPIEPDERGLTYLHGGFGVIFPRLEAALEGQSVGFSTMVHLEPEDSFGDYDASLLHLAAREHFPEHLEPGMGFQDVPGVPDDGRVYVATDFTEDTVVLDGNHPLAGMALRFQLRIVSMKPASEEEIDRESLITEPGEAMGTAFHLVSRQRH
jgi:FKBP-type peptidyl-prolyl cis-trans isomerase SlyD